MKLKLIASSIAISLLAACSSVDKADTSDADMAVYEPLHINFAVKNFAEQEILFALTSRVVARETESTITLVPVRQANHSVINEGLKGGTIGAHWDYTGTHISAQSFDIQPPYDYETLLDESNRISNEQGIVMLAPSDLHNEYVFAVRGDDDDVMNIRSISELSASSEKLLVAVDNDFANDRGNDGLSELKSYYGFSKNIEVVVADTNDDIHALLRTGDVDAALIYATDQQIDLGLLRLLGDDKSFFLPYELTGALNAELAAQRPDLVAAMEKVSRNLNNDLMRYLLQRYQIDGVQLYDVVDEVMDCNDIHLDEHSKSDDQDEDSKDDHGAYGFC